MDLMVVVLFNLAFRQDTLNLVVWCASTSSFLLRDSLRVVRWVRLMVGSTAVGPAPGVFCLGDMAETSNSVRCLQLESQLRVRQPWELSNSNWNLI